MSENNMEESLKEQLRRLKSSTLVLLVLVFSVVGVLIGYYISGDIFARPFKNVDTDILGESTVDISFETSFPAKTKVMYGTSELYMNEMEVSKKYMEEHRVSLKNLLPDRPHFMKLYAKELNGQEHISPVYRIDQ